MLFPCFFQLDRTESSLRRFRQTFIAVQLCRAPCILLIVKFTVMTIPRSCSALAGTKELSVMDILALKSIFSQHSSAIREWDGKKEASLESIQERNRLLDQRLSEGEPNLGFELFLLPSPCSGDIFEKPQFARNWVFMRCSSTPSIRSRFVLAELLAA